MAKTPKPTVSQEKPTRPRPRDAQGRELDAWGLPLSGPARVAVLAALGRPDPNLEPGAWAAPAAPEPPAEQANPEPAEGGETEEQG